MIGCNNSSNGPDVVGDRSRCSGDGVCVVMVVVKLVVLALTWLLVMVELVVAVVIALVADGEGNGTR